MTEVTGSTSSDQSTRFTATTILAAAWALLPAVLGFVLLARIGLAGDWLKAQGDIGALVYVAAFALTAGFGLLPTYAQAVLGGWVFGLVGGLPLALAGFTGGALIGFVVSRLIGRDALERRLAEHPKAAVIRQALIGRGFWPTLGTVTLLRLPPNSPFALGNLAMAGSGVNLGSYLLGTMLGMAPRTAVMVGAGAAGAASGAKDIQTLISERGPWQLMIGIAATVAVLAVLGLIARAALRRAGLSAPTMQT